MEKTIQKFKPIPRFNPHGKECSGHGNARLDCEYTEKDERSLLGSILDKKIAQLEK